MADKRIRKELTDVRDNKYLDVTENKLTLDVKDLFHWRASFRAPPGTPYEGGTFSLQIVFPEKYPFRPPVIRFLTKVYHPNIATHHGTICLYFLRDGWSPAMTVPRLLLEIWCMLLDPSPHEPLVPAIAHQLQVDRQAFQSTAREYTLRCNKILKRKMENLPKRIQKELVRCQSKANRDSGYFCLPDGAEVTPKEDNPRQWNVKLPGPPNSPYEGGTFKLTVTIPEEYPMRPPVVRFVTKICHPNFCYVDGGVSLGLLQSRWSPAIQIHCVLVDLYWFMAEPNPDDSLMCDVAEVMKRDEKEYFRIAKEWTKKYASEN